MLFATEVETDFLLSWMSKVHYGCTVGMVKRPIVFFIVLSPPPPSNLLFQSLFQSISIYTYFPMNELAPMPSLL